MSDLNSMVSEFLAQKRIAVVGVSDQRDTGCNAAFERFAGAGYDVIPVNPRLTEYAGVPCYPDLQTIPVKPDAVFILTNPGVTEMIVDECVALGIGHVWMHCMMGTKPGLVQSMTSVSAAAVEKCKENGINVIPGSCPNQFLNPDFPHRMMRGLWGMLGFMKVEPYLR